MNRPNDVLEDRAQVAGKKPDTDKIRADLQSMDRKALAALVELLCAHIDNQEATK